MIKERDKARKIVNLLMEYYVTLEYDEISFNINVNPNRTLINLEGRVNTELVNLEKLEELFNHPRLSEYEGYYDGLLESNYDKEIYAVGYQVDDYDFSLDGDILRVKLLRNHEI